MGRGSGNATSYTDTLYPTIYSGSQYTLFFKVKNPIALQTNTIYVSNISIVIDYTPGYSTITTVVSPNGGGTITGGGSHMCTSSVTLTATPNNGYKFVKWSDGVETATRTITVYNYDMTYTAIFEKTVIDTVLIGTVKATAIYYNETTKTITFIVDEDVSTTTLGADTVDGYHLAVSKSIPSGSVEITAVLVDNTYIYKKE